MEKRYIINTLIILGSPLYFLLTDCIRGLGDSCSAQLPPGQIYFLGEWGLVGAGGGRGCIRAPKGLRLVSPFPV